MPKGLAALAVLFLLAHLFYLPPSLEDIDSVNFALGVRDFDVARHQPHPPGYPVFIALGKASAAVMRALPVQSPESKALALPGVIAGALLIPLLFGLFRRFAEDEAVAWWAMAVAVCSPLFWFTALRPLSDMTGLGVAVASQWLVLSAWAGEGRRSRAAIAARVESLAASDGRCIPAGGVAPRSQTPGLLGRRALPAGRLARLGATPDFQHGLLAGGAVLCGLAAGIRVQTVMLTAPLLLAVLLWPRTGLSFRDRVIALAAAALGAAAWGLPLLAASGGLGGYLAALGTQAGEDFSGVVMLWTVRQARVAADAVLNTFIWPWKELWLGAVVMVAAAFGAMRLAWRQPARCALLLIAFGPYTVFHLLFHETATMRYALPILPAVAFLAIYAMAGLGRVAVMVTAAAFVFVSLARTVPAVQAYGRDASPAFRAFAAIAGNRAPAAPVLAMHASMRRVEEWAGAGGNATVLRAPHGHEWLGLVELWRREPDSDARFLGDPRRTDLALLDPQARTRVAAERWTLPERPFIAGTRPGAADAYTMRPPGWMLDRGWALSAEVGGITAKDGLGPHVQPSVAWIRGRRGAAELIVGGRHLGPAGDPPARLTLENERGPVDSWEVAPGFFFRRIALAAGTLAGTGYVPLRVSSTAADGSGRMVRVALEQFDLQPDGAVMFGFMDGWQEPEYSPVTSRAWRWMSEQVRLWVRPVGRDVVLTISGESPLKYFDTAPNVRVTAAGTAVVRFTPSSDFTQRIVLPAAALARSGGIVTLESDQWFSPADRGLPDKRHLALRVYSVGVE